MKNTTNQWLLILFICFSLGGCSQRKDPVKKANAINEEKADHDQINETAADFIVGAADARMMDIYEGKLAVEKGTSSSIRAYGKLMVTHRTMLLVAIKALAVKNTSPYPKASAIRKKTGGTIWLKNQAKISTKNLPK